MTTRGPSQCPACVHLRTSEFDGYDVPWTCASFPNGIPVEIQGGQDHRQPIGGEKILFEKAEGDAADFWWEQWEAVNRAPV